jgi:hypothetical protein
MSVQCLICQSPRRLEIDRMLVDGKNCTDVAHTSGYSRNSVENHKIRHLSRQLVQAYEKKSITEGMDLLIRIDHILSRAEKIFIRNYNQHQDMVALKALAETRNTIDLLARISLLMHEAKVMELQGSQKQQEAQQRAEMDEFIKNLCDRLTPAEQDLWEKLAAKIRGEHNKTLAYRRKNMPMVQTDVS